MTDTGGDSPESAHITDEDLPASPRSSEQPDVGGIEPSAIADHRKRRRRTPPGSGRRAQIGQNSFVTIPAVNAQASLCERSSRSVSRRDVRSYAGVASVALSLFILVGGVGAPVTSAAGVAGMTVFLDPGHNSVYDSSIAQQVPNGRGGTKECNTTGTATSNGYPEHAFNWDVAVRVRDALNQLGVQTAMSRDNDSSVGPCVDQRAGAANAMHPDAIVSIHADGASAAGHGFHVNYSSPPLNDTQAGPAVRLATTMRDSLVASGLQTSSYIGSDGLYGRADLAGLNLAQYPAILVECGNMRNPDEAAQMESPEGRAKYAVALTQGIVSYLSTKAAAG
jgi:N-acetylmuramoyl-L-alanine amidase